MNIRRGAGFTLIEIMLVLVLLSMSAIAVIVSLPESKSDQVEKQALRFHQLVQLLNEEALLNGIDYGVRVDEKQRRYQFLKLEASGWKKVEQGRFFTEVALEEDISIELELGGGAWQDKDRLFKPGSLFDEDMFAEFEDKKKVKPPQIMVLSSGDISPFTLVFDVRNPSRLGRSDEETWKVQAQENGVIRLLQPGDDDEAK